MAERVEILGQGPKTVLTAGAAEEGIRQVGEEAMERVVSCQDKTTELVLKEMRDTGRLATATAV